jgi:hypothetical protein
MPVTCKHESINQYRYENNSRHTCAPNSPKLDRKYAILRDPPLGVEVPQAK